ncbi:hypothetical protein GCM10023324_04130 [Streptomyces youssoufiensis]
MPDGGHDPGVGGREGAARGGGADQDGGVPAAPVHGADDAVGHAVEPVAGPHRGRRKSAFVALGWRRVRVARRTVPLAGGVYGVCGVGPGGGGVAGQAVMARSNWRA